MEKLTITGADQEWVADVPQSWDEVPLNIYPNLAQLYLKELPRMTVSDKLVRVLYLLAWSAKDGIDRFDLPHLQQAFKLVEWVFNKVEISINILPEFTHNDIRYLGPDPLLGNMRFGEFVMAETYFLQYWEYKRPETLNKLISVLYRPEGKGAAHEIGNVEYCGDLREKFNSNLTEFRAEELKDLDLSIKDGIYLYYLASRWKAFDSYPHIFPKKKNQKIDTPKQKAPRYGWLGTFDDLVGEKGRTAETLENEFVHTTLMSLERGQIKFKEIKKNRK